MSAKRIDNLQTNKSHENLFKFDQLLETEFETRFQNQNSRFKLISSFVVIFPPSVYLKHVFITLKLQQTALFQLVFPSTAFACFEHRCFPETAKTQCQQFSPNNNSSYILFEGRTIDHLDVFWMFLFSLRINTCHCKLINAVLFPLFGIIFRYRFCLRNNHREGGIGCLKPSRCMRA